ncbi:Center divider [Balamuthia mandrillaris]
MPQLFTEKRVGPRPNGGTVFGGQSSSSSSSSTPTPSAASASSSSTTSTTSNQQQQPPLRPALHLHPPKLSYSQSDSVLPREEELSSSSSPSSPRAHYHRKATSTIRRFQRSISVISAPHHHFHNHHHHHAPPSPSLSSLKVTLLLVGPPAAGKTALLRALTAKNSATHSVSSLIGSWARPHSTTTVALEERAGRGEREREKGREKGRGGSGSGIASGNAASHGKSFACSGTVLGMQVYDVTRVSHHHNARLRIRALEFPPEAHYHSLYLNERALVLLVFDIRKDLTEEFLSKWLSTLTSPCFKPESLKVLLVATHIDKLHSDSKHVLKSFQPKLERLQALFPAVKGLRAVSCASNKGCKKLRSAIVEHAEGVTATIKSLMEVAAHKALINRMKHHCLRMEMVPWSVFMAEAGAMGIPEEKLKQLTAVMHDHGFLTNFTPTSLRNVNKQRKNDLIHAISPFTQQVIYNIHWITRAYVKLLREAPKYTLHPEQTTDDDDDEPFSFTLYSMLCSSSSSPSSSAFSLDQQQQQRKREGMLVVSPDIKMIWTMNTNKTKDKNKEDKTENRTEDEEDEKEVNEFVVEESLHGALLNLLQEYELLFIIKPTKQKVIMLSEDYEGYGLMNASEVERQENDNEEGATAKKKINRRSAPIADVAVDKLIEQTEELRLLQRAKKLTDERRGRFLQRHPELKRTRRVMFKTSWRNEGSLERELEMSDLMKARQQVQKQKSGGSGEWNSPLSNSNKSVRTRLKSSKDEDKKNDKAKDQETTKQRKAKEVNSKMSKRENTLLVAGQEETRVLIPALLPKSVESHKLAQVGWLPHTASPTTYFLRSSSSGLNSRNSPLRSSRESLPTSNNIGSPSTPQLHRSLSMNANPPSPSPSYRTCAFAASSPRASVGVSSSPPLPFHSSSPLLPSSSRRASFRLSSSPPLQASPFFPSSSYSPPSSPLSFSKNENNSSGSPTEVLDSEFQAKMERYLRNRRRRRMAPAPCLSKADKFRYSLQQRYYYFYPLPQGVFPRFLIRMLDLAFVPIYWRHGFVVIKGHERALVEERQESNGIWIQVYGREPTLMWSLLEFNLNNVASYWYSISPQVGIPCTHCRESSDPDLKTKPFIFLTEECDAAMSEGRSYVVCSHPEHKSGASVSVCLSQLMPEASLYRLKAYDVDYSLVQKHSVLAQGNHTIVYKGEYKGKEVAVKEFLFGKVEEGDRFCPEELRTVKEFRSEALIMSGFKKHPNVAQLLGISKQPLALVVEYINGGSLFHFLRENPNLEWALRLDIALDIARGMDYLHSYSPPCIHRDLKSPNVLMKQTTDENGKVQLTAKVSDFGLSINSTWSAGREVDNPLWLAPEVMRGEEYSEKSDVYSYGIILWELFRQVQPFQEYGFQFMAQLEDKIVNSLLRPSIQESSICASHLLPSSEQVPEEYVKLMRLCWDDVPSNRPSFLKILRSLEALKEELVSL